MPLYYYQALSEEGKKIAAHIDADSLQDAKQKLLRRQIIVIKVLPVKEKEMHKQLSKKEVLSLTRELARLIQAGLPLFEGLSALEEKYRGHHPHKTLLDICEQVKTGHPLSRALSRHARSFDVLYISMIANAEKTGSLDLCLSELSQLLERQLHVHKQILSALLYPSLLLVFCLVVLSSLLFFVIPSVQELFEGRELHFFTQIVFSASQFACASKFFLLAFLLILVIGGTATLLSNKGKVQIRNMCIRLPFSRRLFAKIAFVRFCRAVATLLEGGLPLMNALSQARTVMRHPILEKVIAQAEEKIAQGESIAVPFAHPLIPSLVPRMLGIAEQSGKLAVTMKQIAQIYEEELETSFAYFVSLAQPALLLFLGGLVGFILLSVLLPLTDVSTFIN